MQRNWTQVGVEDVPVDQREKVGAILDKLEFFTAGQSERLSTSARLMLREVALKQVVRGWWMAFAESPELAPFNLLGVHVKFADGIARVYVLDRGSDCCIVCSDFWPAGEGAPVVPGTECGDEVLKLVS